LPAHHGIAFARPAFDDRRITGLQLQPLPAFEHMVRKIVVPRQPYASIQHRQLA